MLGEAEDPAARLYLAERCGMAEGMYFGKRIWDQRIQSDRDGKRNGRAVGHCIAKLRIVSLTCH